MMQKILQSVRQGTPLLLFLLIVWVPTSASAQVLKDPKQEEKAIVALIAEYAQTRETQDTAALKAILTEEIDQLVSTGEWRRGRSAALDGMTRSSNRNPGSRTLTVEQLRFLTPETAVVDARYEIRNDDGSIRKMWSTFIVAYEENRWKITAIRNMLPAGGS